MPSTTEEQIVQGMDAVVQAAGPSGPVLVGGFQEWDCTIRHTMVAYAELNEQIDLQLPGKFQVEGTLRRGWQDTAAVTRLLGTTAIGRGIRTRPPKFTVTGVISAPGKPDHGRRFQLGGCSFSSLAWGARSAEAAIDETVNYTAESFAYL